MYWPGRNLRRFIVDYGSGAACEGRPLHVFNFIDGVRPLLPAELKALPASDSGRSLDSSSLAPEQSNPTPIAFAMIEATFNIFDRVDFQSVKVRALVFWYVATVFSVP